jgi:hypothetical protein
MSTIFGSGQGFVRDLEAGWRARMWLCIPPPISMVLDYFRYADFPLPIAAMMDQLRGGLSILSSTEVLQCEWS